MRQLAHGYWVLGVGCWALLSVLNAPTHAQSAGQGTEEAKKETQKTAEPLAPSTLNSQPSTPDGLPILLLVVQRPLGTSVKRDDINTALSLMLRTSVRDSRKYQVILYSPDHPSIRRALLEHAIAASELAEPIKPEALQKLARIIGARNILMVSSVLDKAAMKTDVRLMQDAGEDTWITPLYQPMVVDAQIGKLRLKNEQLIALTVDNIDKYLGVPSHLADNIHLSKTVIIGADDPKKNKKDRNAKNSKDKTRDTAKGDTGIAANTTSPTGEDGSDPETRGQGTTEPTRGNDNGSETGNRTANNATGNNADSGSPFAQPNAPTPNKTTGNTKNNTTKPTKQPADKTRSTQVARVDKGTVPTSESRNANKDRSDNSVKPEANGEQTPPAALPLVTQDSLKEDKNARKNQPTIVNTDAGASLLAEPVLIPPVPPTDKVNHEADADRYRQTGDLSNAIESLRQAINENPMDVHLRKKLIVAYQDRQMADLAVSEIDRAMLLAPKDADLSRLRANTLIGKGDTTSAIKTLRDVVAANPKDTAAQVALGDALLADSQYADAIGAFESAAKNDPKSPLPHRRLARVLAAQAGSDTTKYAACLQQVEQARSLTPPTDTQTYQGDYFEIILLVESRLKDLLDQVNETFGGVGKRSNADLMQHATDLKERAEAAADFLDKLPPAAGQDVTHAHYGQGAALLVQSIGFLRKYIPSAEEQLANSLRSTRLDAITELNNAHNRLAAARGVLEKGRAATGVSSN